MNIQASNKGDPKHKISVFSKTAQMIAFQYCMGQSPNLKLHMWHF
jgi:hypothetical protein